MAVLLSWLCSCFAQPSARSEAQHDEAEPYLVPEFVKPKSRTLSSLVLHSHDDPREFGSNLSFTTEHKDDIVLGKMLGAGSSGEVYQGKWKGQTVAVKVIAHDEDRIVQISNEIMLGMHLRHPHVVQTLHVALVFQPGSANLASQAIPQQEDTCSIEEVFSRRSQDMSLPLSTRADSVTCVSIQCREERRLLLSRRPSAHNSPLNTRPGSMSALSGTLSNRRHSLTFGKRYSNSAPRRPLTGEDIEVGSGAAPKSPSVAKVQSSYLQESMPDVYSSLCILEHPSDDTAMTQSTYLSRKGSRQPLPTAHAANVHGFSSADSTPEHASTGEGASSAGQSSGSDGAQAENADAPGHSCARQAQGSCPIEEQEDADVTHGARHESTAAADDCVDGQAAIATTVSVSELHVHLASKEAAHDKPAAKAGNWSAAEATGDKLAAGSGGNPSADPEPVKTSPAEGVNSTAADDIRNGERSDNSLPLPSVQAPPVLERSLTFPSRQSDVRSRTPEAPPGTPRRGSEQVQEQLDPDCMAMLASLGLAGQVAQARASYASYKTASSFGPTPEHAPAEPSADASQAPHKARQSSIYGNFTAEAVNAELGRGVQVQIHSILPPTGTAPPSRSCSSSYMVDSTTGMIVQRPTSDSSSNPSSRRPSAVVHNSQVQSFSDAFANLQGGAAMNARLACLAVDGALPAEARLASASAVPPAHAPSSLQRMPSAAAGNAGNTNAAAVNDSMTVPLDEVLSAALSPLAAGFGNPVDYEQEPSSLPDPVEFCRDLTVRLSSLALVKDGEGSGRFKEGGDATDASKVWTKETEAEQLMSGTDLGEPERAWAEIWIVQEFCDMDSLAQANANKTFFTKSQMVPNFHAVLLRARDIALGMRYLHLQNVCHCDLKCENILLLSDALDPYGCIAKVTDLGLSRVLQREGDFSSSSPGTITHMAPEIFQKGMLSAAADVYAFGIILWEMASASVPYAGWGHVEIMKQVVEEGQRPEYAAHIPQAYVALSEACWQHDQDRRPTFNELLSDICNLLTTVDKLQADAEAPLAEFANWFSLM